jgi:hypothetical protein
VFSLIHSCHGEKAIMSVEAEAEFISYCSRNLGSSVEYSCGFGAESDVASMW